MSVAYALIYLAVAVAVVSWVVGAVYFVRTLAAIGQEDRNVRWLAMVAWPFAIGRLRGAAAGYASVVNKALVVFFVCILVLAAMVAVVTNLGRIAK
jgi:hypothetical protein